MKNSSYGFTLIEILVAVTIVGVLSTLGITGFQAVTRNGRDALRKSEIEQIRSALEIFKSQNGAYPLESSTCIADLPSDYINPYPVDPKAPAFTYCYTRESALTYQVCAHLENGGTSDVCGGTNACGDVCNYKVINP